MGHIYFIMGISGSGKSTLVRNIKKLDNPNFYFPLSCKTRVLREGEINGVDAHFMSKDEFFAKVQAGDFLEYKIVHETDYYGTRLEDIEYGLNNKKIIIKEIDVEGLEELKKTHPELDNKYTSIFLNLSNEQLSQRIEKRGVFMSNEEIQRRLNSAINETQKANILCDHIIDANIEEKEILNKFLDIIK